MYYLLSSQVIGTTVQAYWVYVIAMSLNLAAFTSDLVRSAIENVPVGIIDAGRSLGMSGKQIRIHIIFPHVLRYIIPGMIVLYIGILKMTSLASVINVREIVYAAQTVIADISRSLEAWIIVALIYIILVVPTTYCARILEKWANKGLQPIDSRLV
jgi:polar amino acid transport system permease protein